MTAGKGGWALTRFPGSGLRPVAGEEIRPGDVIRIEPNEKHWHGAAPETAMTHIAIQEQLDGGTAHWMEPVRQEDYLAPRP